MNANLKIASIFSGLPPCLLWSGYASLLFWVLTPLTKAGEPVLELSLKQSARQAVGLVESTDSPHQGILLEAPRVSLAGSPTMAVATKTSTMRPAEDAQPLGEVQCMTLDGHDIGCLAARQWMPADILRQRGRTLIQLYCEEKEEERQAACALATFLNMQAKHQEDIGAASALRAYYTRIALAEQMRLTRRSILHIESERNKQDAAQQEGLPAATDLTEFERLRIGVLDNQLQIQAQDRKLRCLLAQLTGVNYDSSQVCQEYLEVLECSLDCNRLKQLAMYLRQDLQGWQYLACQVNEDSAPIFAKMLSTIVGGWGLPIPTISKLKAILCPPDYSCLAANMRYELNLTVETHRKWICQAVEEKCEALKLAYLRIELAKQVIATWEGRVEQLEALDQEGESAAQELATARSELLKANAEEIARRLDAKIAEVDLAEATGGISERCCAAQPWLLTGFDS